MAKKMDNQGDSKGNKTNTMNTTDATEATRIPTGYVKQVHDGLAEKAGDLSRIETQQA
jgi:hypothetical protein